MATKSEAFGSHESDATKGPFTKTIVGHLESLHCFAPANLAYDATSLLNSSNCFPPWENFLGCSSWNESSRIPSVRKHESINGYSQRKSPVLLPLRSLPLSKNASVLYSAAHSIGCRDELRMLKAKQLGVVRRAAKVRNIPYSIKNFLRNRTDHSNLQKEDPYKTVMCQAWLEKGCCGFGENCKFAHGESELRPSKMPIKNAKYKTKLCDNYTGNGVCPYGTRCLFIHPSGMGSNAYIRSDRLAMMERERTALGILNGQSLSSFLPSDSATPYIPASWPLDTLKVCSGQEALAKTGLSNEMHMESDAVKDRSTPSASGTPPPINSGSSPELQERDVLTEDSFSSSMKDSTLEVPSTTILGFTKPGGGEKYVNVDPGEERECHLESKGWSIMDPDPFNFSIYTDSQYRQLASIFSPLMYRPA